MFVCEECTAYIKFVIYNDLSFVARQLEKSRRLLKRLLSLKPTNVARMRKSLAG
jgi:hypothetical protein